MHDWRRLDEWNSCSNCCPPTLTVPAWMKKVLRCCCFCRRTEDDHDVWSENKSCCDLSAPGTRKKEVDIKIVMKLEVTCRQFCGLVRAGHHSFEPEFWLAMDQSCFREKQGQHRDSNMSMQHDTNFLVDQWQKADVTLWCWFETSQQKHNWLNFQERGQALSRSAVWSPNQHGEELEQSRSGLICADDTKQLKQIVVTSSTMFSVSWANCMAAMRHPTTIREAQSMPGSWVKIQLTVSKWCGTLFSSDVDKFIMCSCCSVPNEKLLIEQLIVGIMTKGTGVSMTRQICGTGQNEKASWFSFWMWNCLMNQTIPQQVVDNSAQLCCFFGHKSIQHCKMCHSVPTQLSFFGYDCIQMLFAWILFQFFMMHCQWLSPVVFSACQFQIFVIVATDANVKGAGRDTDCFNLLHSSKKSHFDWIVWVQFFQRQCTEWQPFNLKQESREPEPTVMAFLVLFFVLQSLTACHQWWCPWPTFSFC